jgi:hypothetical protein
LDTEGQINIHCVVLFYFVLFNDSHPRHAGLELLFSRHLKAERSEACSEPLIVFVQAITVKGRRKSRGD